MEDDNELEKANRKTKPKPNIFDDDISYDEARQIIKSSPINYEDDDEEEINFDGTPVVKYNNRVGAGNPQPKSPPVPDLSSLAVPASSLASRNSISAGDGLRGGPSAFGSPSSAMMYGLNRSKNITIGSSHKEKDLSTSLTLSGSSSDFLPDTDEMIRGGLKKQVSNTDIDKLHQEIQSLKRSLLSAKRDRWVKLPIDDTLRRIIKGEEFSLELYRSLEDKLELLDRATQRHDGNAVTTAVLFLQRTVSRKIFTRELQARPIAADHYLNYLKTRFDHEEYINTLLLLGRTEEAAIYRFKLSVQTSDVALKLSKLRDSLRSSFLAESSLAADTVLVQDYVDLLERQRPIDDADSKLEAKGQNVLFRDFPRKRSLIDMPVVTTLYYCCLYHYDLKENSLACPDAIRKKYQISEKQFLWTAISARAKLRQWNDIEALLTTKGWFGGTKMKSVVSFDKIVGILYKSSAPPEILEKYLVLIDDLEQRLNLAKKVSCSKCIVDTLVAMKNRPALEEYAAKLDKYSREGLYAGDILNSSSIKWR